MCIHTYIRIHAHTPAPRDLSNDQLKLAMQVLMAHADTRVTNIRMEHMKQRLETELKTERDKNAALENQAKMAIQLLKTISDINADVQKTLRTQILSTC